ncbi:MAG: hypothetical protein LBE12_20320 [Planctomycetaceae bacterium]|nr:hypothetical protein [Planctomycetaceae bacterium]
MFIIQRPYCNNYLALAGLWESGKIPDLAVAFRSTAGYALHTPNRVKRKKNKNKKPTG